jgi:hypothetical protein
MTEDLIVIKKSTIKEKLGSALGKMLKFYTDFNHEVILFWRRLLPPAVGNISLVDATIGDKSFSQWLINATRLLLDNPLTALFFSTFSMFLIGGFFQGRISEVLTYLCFFNILTMMFNVMGWIDKLQGK